MSDNASKRPFKLSKWLDDYRLMDAFTALFALLAVLEYFSASDQLDSREIFVASLTIMIAAFLIFKRRTDEFSAECWNFATSIAFAGVLIGPFIGGFIDGYAKYPKGRGLFDGSDGADLLWYIQVSLFVLAFQFKRIRGSFR